MTYKGSVLYIDVTHPAIRQEIFFKRDMIFSIIKEMHKLNMCTDINPSKIITNYKYTSKQKVPKEIKFFIKEVKNFEIKAKNPEIRAKFEEIKKLLKP